MIHPDFFTDDYGYGPDGDPESPTPATVFAIAVLLTICFAVFAAFWNN